MDKDKRKELQEQYKNRHPEMGVCGWQSGERIWADTSRDTNADFNGTSFQLKLGSWPNRELQAAFKEAPESFSWVVFETLDYEDYADDHSDELEVLLLDFLEKHPNAKPLRPRRSFHK